MDADFGLRQDNGAYLARPIRLEAEAADARFWSNFVGRSPNLAITIFLYVAGFLLVTMAVVLLLQAFGWVQVPRQAIGALALLAVGLGILAGIRNR